MKRTLLATMLSLLLLAQVTGCGTLLFRERQGQESGDVDPNVIVMDGFWLLFFIFPGLVAYGVDLATGAIYLPEGVEKGEGPFFK